MFSLFADRVVNYQQIFLLLQSEVSTVTCTRRMLNLQCDNPLLLIFTFIAPKHRSFAGMNTTSLVCAIVHPALLPTASMQLFGKRMDSAICT